MKTFLQLFFFAALLTNSYAQEIGVPYRVGNKFGISNKAGKIFITPEYDLITPRQQDDGTYFNCHKFMGNEVLTSLVYQNKIIIKDKKHHGFHKDGRFFVGYDYIPKQRNGRVVLDGIEEFQTLYDLTGKKVFEQDYKRIGVITAIDEKNALNEVLMLATDKNNLYSLFVYDLKLKKVTRTFFEKSSHLEIRYNSEYRPNDKSIQVTYLDKTNKGMQSKIDVVAKQIKAVETKPFDIKPKRENYGYEDLVAIPERDFIPKETEPTHKKADEWRAIDTKHKFYWELSKPEEIVFRKESIRAENGYLILENEKMGYFDQGYKKIMVPIKYDEIYKASFSGRNGGYVLRNGDKYGLYIYDYPNNKTIEPIFDKVPLLVNYDYFKAKDPLIKLYDENGRFFCYANGDGVLYFSEK